MTAIPVNPFTKICCINLRLLSHNSFRICRLCYNVFPQNILTKKARVWFRSKLLVYYVYCLYPCYRSDKPLTSFITSSYLNMSLNKFHFLRLHPITPLHPPSFLCPFPLVKKNTTTNSLDQVFPTITYQSHTAGKDCYYSSCTNTYIHRYLQPTLKLINNTQHGWCHRPHFLCFSSSTSLLFQSL